MDPLRIVRARGEQVDDQRVDAPDDGLPHRLDEAPQRGLAGLVPGRDDLDHRDVPALPVADGDPIGSVRRLDQGEVIVGEPSRIQGVAQGAEPSVSERVEHARVNAGPVVNRHGIPSQGRIPGPPARSEHPAGVGLPFLMIGLPLDQTTRDQRGPGAATRTPRTARPGPNSWI